MRIGSMINKLLNKEGEVETNEVETNSEPSSIGKATVDSSSLTPRGGVMSQNFDNAEASVVKVTEEQVLEVLSEVYDPEIPIDIVSLGLIYGVEIKGGNVLIKMTMTAPGCPASTQIAGESKLLLENLPGVESAEIEIVWDPPWDPSKMSEEARSSMGIF